MHRFAFFVDGSNLYGSIRNMSLRIDDYQPFYNYIFEKAVIAWNEANRASILPLAQLRRVYWYVVGHIDDWDLTSPRVQQLLRGRYERERRIKAFYMSEAGRELRVSDQRLVADRAWELCLAEFQRWYDDKRKRLESMKKFFHAVRTRTDFIDIVECGRWRVDFVNFALAEKGLDTSLAVDMVALADNYDVAVVLSGDYDSIPSIRYMKTRDKHVAAVEFLNGYPPEKRGRNFSSHIKLHADFLVQIYEMDLVRNGIAAKMEIRPEEDSTYWPPE
jgi:uncharacterized LabA/DUF88 family protein